MNLNRVTERELLVGEKNRNLNRVVEEDLVERAEQRHEGVKELNIQTSREKHYGQREKKVQRGAPGVFEGQPGGQSDQNRMKQGEEKLQQRSECKEDVIRQVLVGLYKDLAFYSEK